MSRIRLAIGIALLLALAIAAAGCAGRVPIRSGTPPVDGWGAAVPAPQPVKRFKVAFVYPGTVNDQGWSQSHERGRIYLQQQLPDVETSYMAAVGVPDAELVLAELAEKGNRVIFAASSSFTEAVLRVAQRYPNVVFMICSGDKSATNVGAYAGRMYEPRFLSGLVAGKMTRTGIIGYVALSATPETVRDIDAFALGVRAVNPKAQVEVAWTENCLEPQRETDAEKSLLQDKADIIVQQRDDPAAQQPAAEQGVLFIGSNGDLSQPLPGADLLSTGANWGPMYVDLVRAVQNGTWKPGQVWGDISDGTVDLSPLNPVVPQDVRELVSRKRQQILAGEVSIFTGPLRDQQGKLRVKADQTMTDAQLLSMDWFVPGVKLPASKRPGS